MAEAIRHYQAALDIKPNNARVHYNLGTVLADCGRLDEAWDHLQRAVDLSATTARPTTTWAPFCGIAAGSTRPWPSFGGPWLSSPTMRRHGPTLDEALGRMIHGDAFPARVRNTGPQRQGSLGYASA